MKEILTLLATLAVACSLTLPVFATQAGTNESAPTTKPSKVHKMHPKKKGAHKAKSQGQTTATPGQAQSKQ